MTTISPDAAVDDINAFCDALVALKPADDESTGVDRIQALEKAKSILEATQARETANFERRRLSAEAERGVPKDRRGKGLGAEVALARAESPFRGSQHLNLARDLTTDLPHTFSALQSGRIREEHANAVARETRWLAPAHRQEVDLLLIDRFGSLGPRKLAAEARAHAQRLDPAGAVERLAQAEKERCVSLRPESEGMARLSALLPMPQAVGAYAALNRDATTVVGTGDSEDEHGQPRTRSQVMADLFVQRLTGQAAASAVPAEVQVVITDQTLLAGGDTPAWITGHGPIPAAKARHWLADEQVMVYLRRLFTDPSNQQLVGLDSSARLFPPGLRKKIMLRDDICRTPYCEAPIREIDHTTPHRDGGPTNWNNGSGLCSACNKNKENTGWEHRGNAQFLRVTTPTGHHYTVSVPPVLPGRDIGPAPPKKTEETTCFSAIR